MDKTASIAAIALILSTPAAFAQQPPATRSIDPNTFIVGHPASPAWKQPHRNGQHPAVLISRRAVAGSPDGNRFLVQPPASVRWTTQPESLVLAGVPR